MGALNNDQHEALAQKLGKAIFKENTLHYAELRAVNDAIIYAMPLVSRLALHKRMFEIALELKQAEEL